MPRSMIGIEAKSLDMVAVKAELAQQNVRWLNSAPAFVCK